MRQMGTLMLNHGIQSQGRECHTQNGILDFELLAYPAERGRGLENLPELERQPEDAV